LSGGLLGLLDKAGRNINGLSSVEAGQVYVGYTVVNNASP
jgi:hypothetical protein